MIAAKIGRLIECSQRTNAMIPAKVARTYPAANTQIVAPYDRACAELPAMADFLLVFDLDGTLVDSVPDLTDALNTVLGERGYAPLSRAEVAPMVGDGVPTLVARAFAARGGSEAEAAAALPGYTAIYEANATALTRPYPGVPETLAALRRGGYRLGVCTNKPQAATRRVLEGLDLAALFDGVAGGDRYKVRKPDPGHLLRLVAELGGRPARAAMIGDSENDALVAHAAGVPLVLLRYGYARANPESLGAAIVLDHFAELPGALDRLGLTPSA
jgi:phosphoglycolate phosphatase